MRAKTRAMVVAGLSVTTMVLSSCGGGGGGSSSGGTGGAGGSGDNSAAIRGCNPQNPLVPSNTTETCGGNVLDAITAKLVHYNSDTAAPEMDIAESIETTDNQNFTVKLKKGYKFHDGSEVKADNFINAWNFAAYGPNAQTSGYFMEPIEGYADLQAPEGGGTPKAKTLTGLKKVDDHTFTIKTTEKVSNLPVRLGYTAFAPLPDNFDAKTFGEKPIGAGPFKFDSWTKNQEIKLSKFADYAGTNTPKLDSLTFKIYQDSEAAYKDVMANKLDVTDEVPTSALIDDRYKTDLPDRNADKAEGVIQTITFAPTKVDPAVANPKLRQAISMAIDRDTIIKQIFNGTRQPATGWVSPVVDGYKAGACGEFCTFDAAKAKAKLAEAGGFTGRLTLAYNGDAAHKDWVDAVCNSIKNTLSVDCVGAPVVDFKTFRTQVHDRQLKGMFRTGWQMDYPSIENFLTPIFKTKASSNDGDYSNPAFDKKLVEAAAAPDAAQSNTLYQEAEAMLAADMPAIPTWYGKRAVGWSDNVTDVKITAFGTIDTSALAKK